MASGFCKGCSVVAVAIVCAGMLCIPGVALAADPVTGGNKQMSTVYGTVWVKDAIPLQPIAGSLVEIPELGRYAYTDAEGEYLFENVPWGYYLMTAYAANYTSSELQRVCVGGSGSPTCNVCYLLSPTPTAWLLMHYAAYDNNLDGWARYLILRLASAMVPTDSVRCVALVDKQANWEDAQDNNTRLYEFRNNQAILLEDKGELGMGDPQTLADFVTQSISMYPASRYMLTIMDHGFGWEGSCVDVNSQLTSEELGYPFRGTQADTMTTVDMGVAMSSCTDQTGELVDVVAFETCATQHVELAYEIRNHARFLVGSEEISYGMNESAVVTKIVTDPSVSPLTVASDYVSMYEDWYTYPEPHLGAATCSAIDLIFMDDLGTALDDFAECLCELLPTKRSQIESCRDAAEETEHDGIDLLSFVTLIEGAKLSTDKTYKASIGDIKMVFRSLVIAEYHNEYSSGATGLAIFHPENFYYTGGIGPFELYVEESFGCCPELICGSYYTVAKWWEDYLKLYLRPYDTVRPYVGIEVPSADDRYTTNLSTVEVGGIAYDAFVVAKVEWRFFGETTWYSASGTTQWLFTVQLPIGYVVIEVAAYDYNGNVGHDYIMITYEP